MFPSPGELHALIRWSRSVFSSHCCTSTAQTAAQTLCNPGWVFKSSRPPQEGETGPTQNHCEPGLLAYSRPGRGARPQGQWVWAGQLRGASPAFQWPAQAEGETRKWRDMSCAREMSTCISLHWAFDTGMRLGTRNPRGGGVAVLLWWQVPGTGPGKSPHALKRQQQCLSSAYLSQPGSLLPDLGQGENYTSLAH